jgi:FMN reductase
MDAQRWGPPLVVGLGGDPTVAAATDMALITALRGAEDAGARTDFFDGASVERFLIPGAALGGRQALQLAAAVRAADALIVAGPWEGSRVLPLLGPLFGQDSQPLAGLPVGAIATDPDALTAAAALAPLAEALRRMGAWVAPASFAMTARGTPFGPTGLCVDPALRDRLVILGRQLVEFAFARRTLEREGEGRALAARRRRRG